MVTKDVVKEVHLVAWVGICAWIDGCYTPPLLPGPVACDCCGAEVHPEEGEWDMLSLASSAPREAH